ncbi:MAG TPA: acyl-CoA dehydrogenase family protein [Solirubrobacteraceae bacterium]|nr:acyl-CoA dehydrogenase family protein [Solirubrobacteraceae bacterium]
MTAIADREALLLQAVREIARDVASPTADEVDRQARFPSEAIAALRECSALSALVPPELGGGGVSFQTIAACCLELGRCCGATGMVFAMHQIQVATIVRHLGPDPWFESYLAELSEQQRLIASVTSEIGTGGDMGRSIAALGPADGDNLTFEKQAPTVSYGEHADDLLTTLRRTPESEPGDQVVALSRREQTTLEPTGTWDVLGMRGTCSPGFVVRATIPSEQVLTTPFARVAAESMVPASHILWSHVWLGISEDAFDRARSFVRASSKRAPGQPLPAANRLSQVLGRLGLLRAEVSSALAEFCAASEDPARERLSTLAGALRFNNLKIAASEQAVEVCRGALDVCGIVGFKNDTPFSVGRHLRDAMSGPLMIANERIRETNAGLMLIAKEV